MSQTPLKVGLIGGSSGFITNAHQRAIFMDGTRRVSSAALSSNPEKSIEASSSWPYPIEGYESYDAMLTGELSKSKEERVDYVLIQRQTMPISIRPRNFLKRAYPSSVKNR
jgi:predicted dehydrogenase